MKDDWAVVEEALNGNATLGYINDEPRDEEPFAALARLREREAQLLKAAERQDEECNVAEARVAEYEERWAKDNLCGICPYRMAIQARVAQLEEALRRMTEKRITDGEGYAVWAKSVARRALAHPEGEAK